LESYVEKSPILVTLLTPYIGYRNAAEIYKDSLKTNKTIKELVLSAGLMKEEEIDKALSQDNIIGLKSP
jgi:aspartate ammonia-lyase